MPSDGKDVEIDRPTRDALDELRDEWRTYASQYGTHQKETFNARCETYANCADELEEVLQDDDDR